MGAPRYLIALFAAVTLLPACALVWLLVEQDHQLERQQQHYQLERRADAAVEEIQRELGAIARQLPDWLASPPDGFDTSAAVVLAVSDDGMITRRGAPLLFVPVHTAGNTSDNARWTRGERLEFEHNLAGAEREFAAVASSSSGDTRAEALVRLARVQRKEHQFDKAIATYRTLVDSDAEIAGEPASLRARRALCALLADIEQRDELARESTALAGDLARGRWFIDRPTYEFYAGELQRWTNVSSDAVEAHILADAIDTVGASAPGAPADVQAWRLTWIGGRSILSWRGRDGNRAIEFAALPQFVEQRLGRSWQSRQLTALLTDPDGRRVLGDAALPGALEVLRLGPDTHLPWTIRFRPQADADLAGIGSRRRLVALVAVLTIVLIAGSAWFAIRAVQREIAVARLQADFVSAVSHEFRTPLTSLAHLVANLRDGHTTSEARRQQYYEVFARETDRLRRFVETLLDFGRMEAGAARYHFEPSDPAPIVNALVDEFRSDSAASGRTVTVSVSADLPKVRVDREAIGRAVWNVLENAAKYSRPGAPIDVSVGSVNHHVAVCITDHGIGIPANERAEIFRKFYRGAAARASAVKGTGVGLAMVHHIVAAHGGRVDVSSELDSGSTFTISLPAVTGT